MRYIDWIWHINGSLPLAPGQSRDEAFNQLHPLFRERDTSHEWNDDTLTFRKTNQAPQDKLSIFDGGVLQIKNGVAGAVLHYRLASKALLFCFLAPLLFLGIAQLTVMIIDSQSAATKAKAEEAAKKPVKKIAEPAQLNQIDKFLGAPAPEKPKEAEGGGRRNRKPSPTPAYVFAAFFATLYVVGRILEDRLVKSLFRKKLLAA